MKKNTKKISKKNNIKSNKKTVKKQTLKISKIKLILSIFLGLLLIISLTMTLSKSHKKHPIKNDNGIIANNNEEIIKEEKYKGITFTNISLLTENGYTTFKANAKNDSESDIKMESMHVSLKDSDGKEVVKLLIYIPNGLKKGEEKTVTASVKGELKTVVSKAIVD